MQIHIIMALTTGFNQHKIWNLRNIIILLQFCHNCMHVLGKIKTSFPFSLNMRRGNRKSLNGVTLIQNYRLRNRQEVQSVRTSFIIWRLHRQMYGELVMTVSGLQERLFTVGCVGALSSWRFHLHKKLNLNISEIIPNSTNTSVLTLLRICLQNSITAI